ncbi:hypothetical protein LY90DRAFT_667892 [Neocallimastix californiae]|uniref:Uncharacterized protein n=1 Tax=Neocallimastix californiae TaxID=1754190 RepID=A0A1Y2E5D0_9FUNG|nr:hypothetical protein LY90DRAFT_667892 [Neocallimastix californiae]|eukprot:ORY66722.1 hypothetical protein LY90DRAFT_667892 [Neocallimastix californiae]
MIYAMKKKISFFETNSLYNEDCNNTKANSISEEEIENNSILSSDNSFKSRSSIQLENSSICSELNKSYVTNDEYECSGVIRHTNSNNDFSDNSNENINKIVTEDSNSLLSDQSNKYINKKLKLDNNENNQNSNLDQNKNSNNNSNDENKSVNTIKIKKISSTIYPDLNNEQPKNNNINSNFIKYSKLTCNIKNNVSTENNNNKSNNNIPSKVLLHSKMDIDEKDLASLDEYNQLSNRSNINLNVNNNLNDQEKGSLKDIYRGSNKRIKTIASMESLNDICSNLFNKNNQKVKHIGNNKLLLENKELREKVRKLNEKLAYHQSYNRLLKDSRIKLPLLKISNEKNSKCTGYGKQKKYSENLKLPKIQNKPFSNEEPKDNSINKNRIKMLKLQSSKGKIPVISKKINIVRSNNNISNFISNSNNDRNNKIDIEQSNTIINSNNDISNSSLIKKNSYYQKLFDTSKSIVKMDSDITRKSYKIKLKQDIENLDQEINNWS